MATLQQTEGQSSSSLPVQIFLDKAGDNQKVSVRSLADLETLLSC